MHNIANILVAVGIAFAILGVVQAATGRQFWSSSRLGQRASRRAGLIGAAAGALSWAAGALLHHAFG
jgi:hypothetical protein